MKVKHSSKLRKTGMKTSTAYSITAKLFHVLNVTTYILIRTSKVRAT